MIPQDSPNRKGSLSERIYRLLLLLYPRRFRKTYGSEMVAAFRYRRTLGESGIRFWSWILIGYHADGFARIRY